MSPPRERLDTGDRTSLGRPWLVIVLNDNHNTFEGVAFALSAVLPGLDYDGGMRFADKIAVVDNPSIAACLMKRRRETRPSMSALTIESISLMTTPPRVIGLAG